MVTAAESAGARRPALLTLNWWRGHPFVAAGVALIAVAALGVAWYLFSPYFIRTRLVESPGAIAAGATRVARGTFSDRDAIHRGSGTATLYRTPSGGAQLQLQHFRVTNGPDLYVYLTPHAAPNTHDDVVRDALQVGRLKASEGAFAYDLPAGIDPSKYRAAVIYCLQFSVIFSVAPLGAG